VYLTLANPILSGFEDIYNKGVPSDPDHVLCCNDHDQLQRISIFLGLLEQDRHDGIQLSVPYVALILFESAHDVGTAADHHIEALLFAFFTVAFAANGSSTYTYQHQGSQAFALALGLNTTSNDLHFNMSAPSTYSWFAFGIGGQMKNSLMFIGYPSSNGSGNSSPADP
jgi:hypothetical protein